MGKREYVVTGAPGCLLALTIWFLLMAGAAASFGLMVKAFRWAF